MVSATVTAPDTWYHVRATWNGATKAIYINGVLDASSAQTGTFDTDADVDPGSGMGLGFGASTRLQYAVLYEYGLSATPWNGHQYDAARNRGHHRPAPTNT